MSEDLSHIRAETVQEIDIEKMMNIWRDVCHEFGQMGIFLPRWVDLRASWSSIWTPNDHMTANLKTAHWQRTLDLLERLNSNEVELLKVLSEINLQHITEHQKFYALIVTTIASGGLALATFVGTAEFGPAELLSGVLPLLFIVALSLVVVWKGHWQAFELDTCIKLAQQRQMLENKKPVTTEVPLRRPDET
jgi:hypothetical protein